MEALGCSIEEHWCGDAPKWLYSTSYWTGCVYIGDVIREVYSYGGFGEDSYQYDYNSGFGVRPVIVMTT